MAYLHCHTKNCGWSQSDFWTLRYNPITQLLEATKWLLRPRTIILNSWLIKDLQEFTGINLKAKAAQPKGPEGIQPKVQAVHSWRLLRLEAVKILKPARQQQWWTYNLWKKAAKPAVCPQCKTSNFDID